MLLDDMIDKELNLTVMLDSCHCGSISCGEDLVQSIPWNVEVDSESSLQILVLAQPPALKEKILQNTVTTSPWLLHPHDYTLCWRPAVHMSRQKKTCSERHSSIVECCHI